MDVLDEKANGVPPMEIDEVVSVHDRESHKILADSIHDVVSSHADEAFVAKHLPDLGHDVKDLKVFSWTLRGWKKLEKKLTSEEFECGGHKWHVPWILASRIDVEVTISFPLLL